MRASVFLAVAMMLLGVSCRGQSPVIGEVSQDMGSDGLGEPCIPADEVSQAFPGYSLEEVSVESSAMCASGVCLVNHLQGRASCPYGQTDEQVQQAPACFVPGSELPVMTPVRPQITTRRAQDVAICSCRCAGPGPGPFCTCSSGMECAELFAPNEFLGSESGSYCIKAGTAYDPKATTLLCTAPDACGNPRPY